MSKKKPAGSAIFTWDYDTHETGIDLPLAELEPLRKFERAAATALNKQTAVEIVAQNGVDLQFGASSNGASFVIYFAVSSLADYNKNARPLLQKILKLAPALSQGAVKPHLQVSVIDFKLRENFEN